MKSLQITFGLLLLLIASCVPRSNAQLEAPFESEDNMEQDEQSVEEGEEQQNEEDESSLDDEENSSEEDQEASNDEEDSLEELDQLIDEDEEAESLGPNVGEDENDENDTGYTASGTHVQTNGIVKQCSGHEDCYDQREPSDWCRPESNQRWTDKGCFCDNKSRTCVIERYNDETLEYTECAPRAEFNCP